MEARYVKVASRFFLVGKAAGSAGAGGGGGDGDGDLHRHHFLDACFLCKRDISGDRHIFMYKGDAAFCSDECRQDQRDMDAALKAARRRQRHLLRRTASLPLPAPSSSAAAAAAATAPVAAMPRRPTTVAGLPAHTPPSSCPAS